MNWNQAFASLSMLISVSCFGQIAIPYGTTDPGLMTPMPTNDIEGSMSQWCSGTAPAAGDNFVIEWHGSMVCSVSLGVTWVYLFVDDGSPRLDTWLGPVIANQPIVQWRIDPQIPMPQQNPVYMMEAWAPPQGVPCSTEVNILDGNAQSPWWSLPPGLSMTLQSLWFVPDSIGGYHGFLGLPTTVTT